jgi:anaerobic magnesium-protoporphyrin IX monomethyl ester cyclase
VHLIRGPSVRFRQGPHASNKINRPAWERNIYIKGVLDVVFINASNQNSIYQGLADEFSAIEPPTWALLLAESVRSINYKTAIIDALAENLTDKQVLDKVIEYNPRLICFVVYGQNVNAGTVGMSGATRTAKYLKAHYIQPLISFIGSYVQALPKKSLEDESAIDFVFTNEGVYSLRNILELGVINKINLSGIKGIAYRHLDTIKINPAEQVVPTERMDIDLPGYAWDLLPFNKQPLDLYRSPMWHAEYDENKRSPYAAIQTSLGCLYGCTFCMINIINRDDEEEVGVGSNYSKMRFWSPNFIIKEFDKLANLGVRTIRITDEMFLLNRKYLNLVRLAGIKWLCLGIESADKKVRLEISKGKFEEIDIREIVSHIHEADIDVMANYIVGLPGENLELMQKTFDLALELNTLAMNVYAAMALPGSQLYKQAIENGYQLPAEYTGYSFHSYDTLPMQTEYLTAAEILKFRDDFFIKYHSDSKFQERLLLKFGEVAVNNVNKSLKIVLRRKILEYLQPKQS